MRRRRRMSARGMSGWSGTAEGCCSWLRAPVVGLQMRTASIFFGRVAGVMSWWARMAKPGWSWKVHVEKRPVMPCMGMSMGSSAMDRESGPRRV